MGRMFWDTKECPVFSEHPFILSCSTKSVSCLGQRLQSLSHHLWFPSASFLSCVFSLPCPSSLALSVLAFPVQIGL